MSITFKPVAFLALALLSAPPAFAQDWQVQPASVRAHEEALAGDALRGRGSATPDEAKAADYVAAQFKAYGLKAAPGMDGYLQRAEILRYRLDAPAQLSVGGNQVPATLFIGSGAPASGKLAVAKGDRSGWPKDAAVLLIDADWKTALQGASRQEGAKLIILRESADSRAFYERLGGRARFADRLKDSPPSDGASLVTVPSAVFDKLAQQQGAEVSLALPGLKTEIAITTNALGWLPGTDPQAGVILYSAHLDHLGVRPDGVVMHGANDDASGTTAVLELAQALSSGKPTRRGILFVAYGSEEIGGFGSRYFGTHPPVPLTDIVANIEFEMIGAQDPKLPKGKMMMTGFERSNLGPALAEHGALVTADIYPDQNFFRRSDNYSLALKGVVAHTISGWAVVPTYHQPTDTVANLDVDFMTRAIQSLIAPARWLADSDFKPEWAAGGRPQ